MPGPIRTVPAERFQQAPADEDQRAEKRTDLLGLPKRSRVTTGTRSSAHGAFAGSYARQAGCQLKVTGSDQAGLVPSSRSLWTCSSVGGVMKHPWNSVCVTGSKRGQVKDLTVTARFSATVRATNIPIYRRVNWSKDDL